MYNIVQQLINHTWNAGTTGDQQYIYYIVGALICCGFVAFIDVIFGFFGILLRNK